MEHQPGAQNLDKCLRGVCECVFFFNFLNEKAVNFLPLEGKTAVETVNKAMLFNLL